MPDSGILPPLRKLTRRNLVVASLTLAPLALAVGSVIALRIPLGMGPRSLSLTAVFLIYMGFLQSLVIGLHFRRPLVDPTARTAIFGKREKPRPSFWMILLFLALCAPALSLMAHEWREINRQKETSQAGRRAFQAEQIAFHTNTELHEQAAALEQERLAEECRAKAVRGEPPEGTRSWADQAKIHESQALWWRAQATRSSNMRNRIEQLGRQR
jgi:hypothetical protein